LNTELRPSQNNRYTSISQIIQQLKKHPDWHNRFEKEDFGLLPVKKQFPKLKVVLLELKPKEDWPGEYTLLTDIWSKWLKEMGITSFSFVKDDNINEVNESIEKLLQVRLPNNKQTVQWTAVTETDPMIAAADSAWQAAKKKVPTTAAIIDNAPATSNAVKKKKKKLPVTRQSLNEDDEVTFGPVY
jgi:hypothetical protein